MNSLPGTYALIMKSSEQQTIPVGKLGHLHIEKGFYVYVGSALGNGGICARIRHHMRTAQTLHWHIDYLRVFVCVEAIWYSNDRNHREHRWAHIFENIPVHTFSVKVRTHPQEIHCWLEAKSAILMDAMKSNTQYKLREVI